jgi:cytoskeletal protein CcmA (bactofilin family)
MAENLSQGAFRASGWDVPSAGPVTEHATIGASVVIKGEVSGKEHLFVDGSVEGSIHFPEHRVTIGRSSRVTADIHAREVVVMGTVKGDIYCGDLLDIRADSHIQGQIVTRRVRIDDGAFLKGSVEIQRGEKENREPPKPIMEAAKPEVTVVAAAAAAAQGKPESASQPAETMARKVAGSGVLFKPVH